MFRATMCPSSGAITVSMQHLVLVILYGWLSGMQGAAGCTLHTRQSSTQSDKYEVSHRYGYFSWWWAHSRPKHVQKRNKRTKKNCAPCWLYLQDYTRMHSQQNIKFLISVLQLLFISSSYSLHITAKIAKIWNIIVSEDLFCQWLNSIPTALNLTSGMCPHNVAS